MVGQKRWKDSDLVVIFFWEGIDEDPWKRSSSVYNS